MTTQTNIRRSASHWNTTLPCAECQKETDHRVMLGNCFWNGEEWVYLQECTYGYCYDCGAGWSEEKFTKAKFQQVVTEMKEYYKRQYRPIAL